MANESTTTTLNDIVYAAVIEQTFLDYAYDFTNAIPLFRQFSLVGRPSNVLQLPRITSDMTVNDNGASTDGEFDATEGNALANTAVDTENVQCTVGEYGFQTTVTDNVSEDSILGPDFMSMIVMHAARIIATAKETDAVALFASASNSVGSTGVNITIAQAVAMADGIRTRGIHAPDGIVYFFDDQTWADLRDLCIAVGSSMAVYASAADRILGVSSDSKVGLADGRVGTFLGFPAYSSGLTPTANSAADVVSAAFVHSTPANDGMAAYGAVAKRPFRVEPIRVPGSRGTQVVFTERSAVGEIQDAAATKAVTDL